MGCKQSTPVAPPAPPAPPARPDPTPTRDVEAVKPPQPAQPPAATPEPTPAPVPVSAPEPPKEVIPVQNVQQDKPEELKPVEKVEPVAVKPVQPEPVVEQLPPQLVAEEIEEEIIEEDEPEPEPPVEEKIEITLSTILGPHLVSKTSYNQIETEHLSQQSELFFVFYHNGSKDHKAIQQDVAMFAAGYDESVTWIYCVTARGEDEHSTRFEELSGNWYYFPTSAKMEDFVQGFQLVSPSLVALDNQGQVLSTNLLDHVQRLDPLDQFYDEKSKAIIDSLIGRENFIQDVVGEITIPL